MKKTLALLLALVTITMTYAQTKIQLRTTDKAECVSSDYQQLKASFSFAAFEAKDMYTKKGEFSWLSMANTVIGGNEGDPQIPVVNELIAVPLGAQPTIRVTSYSTTDYSLNDLGIKTLIPRQPSLRKDKKPEDVPFIYNEAAYQSRGMRSEPKAMVNVVGTMRGVQLGKMTIEPVSYDPVSNTLRVFNDIEVEVNFNGADANATEKMLVDTYSPYFDIVYKQLFNGKAVLDAYTEHPDLYTTPVKMLVVTTSTYANSTAFQNWLTWKKQKGINVDVQTVANNASANTIKNLIYSRYNTNHPSFLVIVGDETVVTYYQLWDYESSYGKAASDLEYASVDGDVYHDMFISRMPVSSTTELSNLINKILTYEKYTMSDPSYLDETLLIAGWDSQATEYIGKPTIQYANNYYFNSAHGITPHVFLTTGSGQTTCYNYINNVGFVNYTAHGDIQKWHDPEFTNSNVNNLTNNDKYFWVMGNCCLTANFKNEQNNLTCFGEAMVRAANKGAWGYIGSVPESLWYEDYYFAVGATNTFGQMPTKAQTSKGAYDALFDDTGFNTLNSVPYIGNVAVTYAHAGNYQSSVDDEYYWRAYQCFGDGSVMPYLKNPAANNVDHASIIQVGSNSFTVNADAGSYVSVTKNNEILGVAQVGTSGSVNVPISGLTSTGDVMVVVTRNQRQPYITTIQAVQADGPFIILDSYTPDIALVNEDTNLSLTFRNQGNAATSGTTIVTLTGNSEVSIVAGQKTFGTLASNATTTVNGFCFRINSGITPGSDVTLHYNVANGSNNWEGDINVTANQIFNVSVTANNANYGTVSGGGQFNYNESCTVTATPADGYLFTNWTQNNVVVSTNVEYTFNVTSEVSLVANFAEGVVIGDGGTTTNNYLPSYSYYKYSLSEQIYTPSELGGMGYITSIAFYNDGDEKTRTYEFYMKATTKGSFSSNTDWIAVSATDKVFSGSVTMVAGDWTTIVFSTPFFYDGTSNVVLVTDDNSGGYTNSPHMACRVFSDSSKALYVYSDNKDYNPLSPPTSYGNNEYKAVLSVKNQLIITKTSAESFQISASSNPTEGGTVAFGSTTYEDLVYDFDDNSSQGWTTLQGTNGTSSHNWMHSSDYTYIVYEEQGHNNSTGFMLSESYISGTQQSSGTAVYPDNYLISPLVRLGGSIHFYATNPNDDYGEEHFSVEVSTNSNTNVNDFTMVQEWTLLSKGMRTVSNGIWYEYTADLSSFSGMGYIAIHHFNCYDQWLLCIDDITIVGGGNSNGSTSINGNYIDGNTCTVTATPNDGYFFAHWTENGVVVSTSASYTFTVTDDRDLVANFATSFSKEISGYNNNGNGWYLIASPLVNAINPTNVDNLTNNDFDLYYFNQENNLEWLNYKADAFNLESGKGYLYANSDNVTLTFTGVPYTGDGKVTLNYANGNEFAGWNLVGNPFPVNAYIAKDFYVLNTSRTELTPATAGTAIGAMEGLFVVAEQNGESLAFSTEAPQGKSAAMTINVTRQRGMAIDRAIVRFDKGDMLPKFMLNEKNTKLYIPQDDKEYAIAKANENGEMPLYFKASENGTYTLDFNKENVDFSYLHLIDNLTGNNVDLLASPSYTFDAKTTDYASRFKLVFATDGTSNEHFAFFSNGNLIINNDGMATLQMIDINGRILSSENINGCHNKSLDVTPGVYMLRLINGQDIKTQKIIVK